MRIGSSIGLLAVGLILALAVEDRISGVDLSLVGWILALVGLVGLVASLAMSRRTARPVDPAVEEPVVREQRVVREPTVREQPVVREGYPQERIERRPY
jgi:type IV secretory pathway TrbD component